MEYILWYSWLIVVLLLMAVCNRHIIWFSGYSFFSPILLAFIFSHSIISTQWVLFLVLISFIWWMMTKKVTEHINLSLYPKYSLYSLITLFILLWAARTCYYFDILMGIDKYNIHFLGLVVILVMSIMPRLFNESKKILSLTTILYFLRFIVISYGGSLLLQSEKLLFYFSRYPFLVLLMTFVTLLFGFYNWLQIREMVRFRKLIWSRIISKKIRLKIS